MKNQNLSKNLHFNFLFLNKHEESELITKLKKAINPDKYLYTYYLNKAINPDKCLLIES